MKFENRVETNVSIIIIKYEAKTGTAMLEWGIPMNKILKF